MTSSFPEDRQDRALRRVTVLRGKDNASDSAANTELFERLHLFHLYHSLSKVTTAMAIAPRDDSTCFDQSLIAADVGFV